MTGGQLKTLVGAVSISFFTAYGIVKIVEKPLLFAIGKFADWFDNLE